MRLPLPHIGRHRFGPHALPEPEIDTSASDASRSDDGEGTPDAIIAEIKALLDKHAPKEEVVSAFKRVKEHGMYRIAISQLENLAIMFSSSHEYESQAIETCEMLKYWRMIRDPSRSTIFLNAVQSKSHDLIRSLFGYVGGKIYVDALNAESLDYKTSSLLLQRISRRPTFLAETIGHAVQQKQKNAFNALLDVVKTSEEFYNKAISINRWGIPKDCWKELVQKAKPESIKTTPDIIFLEIEGLLEKKAPRERIVACYESLKKIGGLDSLEIRQLQDLLITLSLTRDYADLAVWVYDSLTDRQDEEPSFTLSIFHNAIRAGGDHLVYAAGKKIETKDLLDVLNREGLDSRTCSTVIGIFISKHSLSEAIKLTASMDMEKAFDRLLDAAMKRENFFDLIPGRVDLPHKFQEKLENAKSKVKPNASHIVSLIEKAFHRGAPKEEIISLYESFKECGLARLPNEHRRLLTMFSSSRDYEDQATEVYELKCYGSTSYSFEKKIFNNAIQTKSHVLIRAMLGHINGGIYVDVLGDERLDPEMRSVILHALSEHPTSLAEGVGYAARAGQKRVFDVLLGIIRTKKEFYDVAISTNRRQIPGDYWQKLFQEARPDNFATTPGSIFELEDLIRKQAPRKQILSLYKSLKETPGYGDNIEQLHDLLDIFALSLDYENQAIEVALGIGRKCVWRLGYFSPQSKCSSDGTSEILHHAIGSGSHALIRVMKHEGIASHDTCIRILNSKNLDPQIHYWVIQELSDSSKSLATALVLAARANQEIAFDILLDIAKTKNEFFDIVRGCEKESILEIYKEKLQFAKATF